MRICPRHRETRTHKYQRPQYSIKIRRRRPEISHFLGRLACLSSEKCVARYTSKEAGGEAGDLLPRWRELLLEEPELVLLRTERRL